jgi:hypothetical protein
MLIVSATPAAGTLAGASGLAGHDQVAEPAATTARAYLLDDVIFYSVGVSRAWQGGCYDEQDEAADGAGSSLHGDALSRKHSNGSDSSSISVTSSTALSAGLSAGLRRRQTGSTGRAGR